MTTYADPTRCPDCGALLPRQPQVCPVCALPLLGPGALTLFRTLQEADRLLGVLREQKRPAPVAAGTMPPGSPREDGGTPQAPGRPEAEGSTVRVSGSSVPRILLTLGALCLLVAAITFLAFAWSWLGVGGRTVVLVALTGAGLGLSVTLLRRGLRMASESLAVVGLGLVALDVVGARHAGWLGTIDDAELTLLAGTVVAAASLVLLVGTVPRPLLGPGLVTPLAVLVATIGAEWNAGSPLPAVIALAVLLGLGRLGRVLPSATLTASALTTSVAVWLYVLAAGLDDTVDQLTFAHVWGDVAAWPLLACVAVAALLGPTTGLRHGVDVTGYAVAALLGTYVAVLPILDNQPDAITLALVAATAAWTVVLLGLHGTGRAVAAVALAGSLPVPVAVALELLREAGRAVTEVGDPFSRSVGVHVTPPPHNASAWLLPVTCVVVTAAVCALLALVAPFPRRSWILGGAVTAVLVPALATPPLYDVPLALPVGLALGFALVALVTAEHLDGQLADAVRAGAAVLTVLAVLVSTPSDVLTSVSLALPTVVAAVLMRRADRVGSVAAASFPPAFAGLVWASLNVAGVDEQYRAIPVLLVLGGLALWRSQPELELSAAFAGAVAAAGAIAYATDPSLALAVHLTVSGALVTASSIIHPSRRAAGWLGGFLLAAATWVRLAELGVHTPEAYTLPSAAALVGVGLWRLRQNLGSATITFLAPGLALATVPSLAATLVDPYSWRALLLGIACLLLVLAGVGARWGAPLVVGATVGGLLVLRELAPYAAHVPTWLTIGASGAVLLVVGVTWESRINDMRRASRYVAALR